jgi:Carboxypeptidase regulatory-like domain
MAAVLVYVPGMEYAVRTDPSGRFAFDSLPSGFITLRAEFIGYRAGQRNRVQVAPGKRVGIHFRLLDCPIQDNPNVIRESAPAPCVANFRTAVQALPLVQVAGVGRVVGMRDTIVERPWFNSPQEAEIYRIELRYGWRWDRSWLIEVLDPVALTDCSANYSPDEDVLVMADTTAGLLVALVGAPNGLVTLRKKDITQLGAPVFQR